MANVIDQQQTASNDSVPLRYNTATAGVGQKFIPTVTAKCTQVIFKAVTVGNPNADVVVKIYSDSSGVPGSLLATSDAILTSAMTVEAEYTWAFSGANIIYLYKNQTYHFVLVGSYAISTTNYVGFVDNNAGGYANGVEELMNGTTWGDRTGYDMYFKEYYDDTTIIRGGPLFFAQY